MANHWKTILCKAERAVSLYVLSRNLSQFDSQCSSPVSQHDFGRKAMFMKKEVSQQTWHAIVQLSTQHEKKLIQRSTLTLIYNSILKTVPVHKALFSLAEFVRCGLAFFSVTDQLSRAALCFKEDEWGSISGQKPKFPVITAGRSTLPNASRLLPLLSQVISEQFF